MSTITHFQLFFRAEICFLIYASSAFNSAFCPVALMTGAGDWGHRLPDGPPVWTVFAYTIHMLVVFS